MCLSRKKKYKYKDYQPGEGYKVVKKYKYVDGFCYKGVCEQKPYYLAGVWITDPYNRMLAYEDALGGYRTGFHIFKQFKEARKWSWKDDIIVKVKYKLVTAVGFQGIAEIIVAREMMVIKEIGYLVYSEKLGRYKFKKTNIIFKEKEEQNEGL